MLDKFHGTQHSGLLKQMQGGQGNWYAHASWNVTLQSEFWAKALGGVSMERFIFDKPFLILMQRSNRNRPYFAAWIGNARLLEAP